MLAYTATTTIPVMPANALFPSWGISSAVSRFVQDVLATQLIGCNITHQELGVLVDGVLRCNKYDLEALIESPSKLEDYQLGLDALHLDINHHE